MRSSILTTSAGTVVSFHAHPDDEVLLTGGTLALLAEQGHRVVLVTATLGERGLSDGADDLGKRRQRELLDAAAHLGVARVEVLGYRDSGWLEGDATSGLPAFADVEVEVVAQRLALLLLEEDAAVLTSYDAAGGYGHPDHVQVHRVGRRAAEIAGTPLLLEATLDRTWVRRVLRLARVAGRVLPLPEVPAGDDLFTARADLTHCLDVRAQVPRKRAALAAHASQQSGGPRTASLLLRLPRPVVALVWGHEWFRQVGLADHGRDLRTARKPRRG